MSPGDVGIGREAAAIGNRDGGAVQVLEVDHPVGNLVAGEVCLRVAYGDGVGQHRLAVGVLALLDVLLDFLFRLGVDGGLIGGGSAAPVPGGGVALGLGAGGGIAAAVHLADLIGGNDGVVLHEVVCAGGELASGIGQGRQQIQGEAIIARIAERDIGDGGAAPAHGNLDGTLIQRLGAGQGVGNGQIVQVGIGIDLELVVQPVFAVGALGDGDDTVVVALNALFMGDVDFLEGDVGAVRRARELEGIVLRRLDLFGVKGHVQAKGALHVAVLLGQPVRIHLQVDFVVLDLIAASDDLAVHDDAVGHVGHVQQWIGVDKLGQVIDPGLGSLGVGQLAVVDVITDVQVDAGVARHVGSAAGRIKGSIDGISQGLEARLALRVRHAHEDHRAIDQGDGQGLLAGEGLLTAQQEVLLPHVHILFFVIGDQPADLLNRHQVFVGEFHRGHVLHVQRGPAIHNM